MTLKYRLPEDRQRAALSNRFRRIRVLRTVEQLKQVMQYFAIDGFAAPSSLAVRRRMYVKERERFRHETDALPKTGHVVGKPIAVPFQIWNHPARRVDRSRLDHHGLAGNQKPARQFQFHHLGGGKVARLVRCLSACQAIGPGGHVMPLADGTAERGLRMLGEEFEGFFKQPRQIFPSSAAAK